MPVPIGREMWGKKDGIVKLYTTLPTKKSLKNDN